MYSRLSTPLTFCREDLPPCLHARLPRFRPVMTCGNNRKSVRLSATKLLGALVGRLPRLALRNPPYIRRTPLYFLPATWLISLITAQPIRTRQRMAQPATPSIPGVIHPMIPVSIGIHGMNSAETRSLQPLRSHESAYRRKRSCLTRNPINILAQRSIHLVLLRLRTRILPFTEMSQKPFILRPLTV